MAVWSKEVFAANLRRYIALTGVTQKDLAKKIGVSAPTMHDWVKGNVYPRIDKIEKLAAYFGCLKSDLIEEKQQKPATNEGSELSPAKLELIERLKSMSEADLKRLDMLLQIFEKEKA